MENNLPSLFIGMPAYNDERYIQKAIESLLEQTYTNWVLFISDNNSLDTTSELCTNIAKNDKRIIYFKQDHNIGLKDNFNFVYDVFNEDYQSQYFMWAQTDDIWEPSYLETCINLLKNNKESGVSFTGMNNIDSFGAIIRQYPSFKRFSSNNRIKNQLKYLFEPELLGKCNMFLGVYSKETINKILSKTRYTVMYSDYVIGFGILTHSHITCSNKVLYHKRDDRIEDEERYPTPVIIMSLRNGVFSLFKLIPLHLFYTKHINNIVKKIVILLIMLLRIPRSLYSTLIRYIQYFRYSNIHKFRKHFFNYYAKFWLDKFDFKKVKREKIDIGYGYAYTSSELALNLNQLHVKLKCNSGKINYQISETPHLSFVLGILNNTDSISKKEEYINYKKKHFPEINTSEQVKSFEELTLSMKADYENNSLNVCVLIKNNISLPSNNYKTSVIDGTHRLAVLAGLGVEKVVCKFVDKIENYND
jgi:glycosyltransferase involved in cell wall biosynthesis